MPSLALMEAPIRVTAADKQPLRLAVDVSAYGVVDLLLTVYEGSNVAVRVLTGTQTQTEDNWIALEGFPALNAGQSSQKTYSGFLKYARWEVTSSGNATFLVRGICRAQDYYSDARMLSRLGAGTTALTITAGAASTWKTTAGALTVDGFAGLNLQAADVTVLSLSSAGSKMTLAANKNFDAAAGSSAIDLSAATGDFAFTTGAVSWSGAAGKGWTLTQGVATSGSPTALRVNGGAHTTLAASSEAVDVNFNLARTVQFATGNIATQRAMVVQAPTYNAVAASTITSAATLAVTGAPSAGTSVTITNPYALWVQGGATQLDGPLTQASGAVSLTGSRGSAFTLGNKNGAPSLALLAGTGHATVDVASTANIGILFGFSGSYGGGQNVIFIGNMTSAPTSNPSSGGIMYASAGAGKWRGSSGTTTTFGPAGPHCGNCGYDAWRVAQYNTTWQSWHYECGNCGTVYKGGPADVRDLLSEDQKQELLRPDMTWADVVALVERPAQKKGQT